MRLSGKGVLPKLPGRKNENCKGRVLADTCEQQHDNEMSKSCINRVGSHDFSCKASFVGYICKLQHEGI